MKYKIENIFGINSKLAMKIERNGTIEIIKNKPIYSIPIKNKNKKGVSQK